MKPFEWLSAALSRARLDYDAATLRDATRIAVQSAAAAVAAYLALTSIGSEQLFVGILSGVMILQPSVGGTMQSARTRLLASAIGSVIGMACLFALPAGFGTAFGLLVTMFILQGVAKLKPAWSYGVVAAVALSLSTSGDLVQATLDRLIAIGTGAGVGLPVAAIVWRDTAGERFERHMAAAMGRLRTALSDVFDKAGEDEPRDDIEGRAAVQQSLADAEEACDAMHLADTGTRRARMRQVRSLFDSIWLMDAVAERTGDLTREGLGEGIARFREAADAVLEGLTEDDLDVGAVGRLDEAFDALAGELDGVSLPDDRRCDQAHVIGFAAGSIRDRLADLVEGHRERHDPAPGWADRFSVRRRARP